eukprot:20725-Pelagomonas_calceolata.AAC.1
MPRDEGSGGAVWDLRALFAAKYTASVPRVARLPGAEIHFAFFAACPVCANLHTATYFLPPSLPP